MTLSKALQADLALLGNTVIWGITFVVVQGALKSASPVLFVALRFSLAGAILAVLYRRKLDRRTIAPGFCVGLLLFAGFALQTEGLRFTSASKSAFITGLSIPMVPLLGSCVYKKRPLPVEIAGVLAATLGMGLMTLPDVHMQVNPGDVFTLLGAAAFAGHIVALGYFTGWARKRQMGFESLAVWQIVSAALCGLASFKWLDVPKLHLNSDLYLALAITGLLATALAFTVQAWAQAYTTATRTALIFSLEPVFAWVTSWVLTGELLSRKATAGAILILASILLVEVKRTDVSEHPTISAATPDV